MADTTTARRAAARPPEDPLLTSPRSHLARRGAVPEPAPSSRWIARQTVERATTNVGSSYDDRMKGKQRLSASVDAELMQAGHEAVAEGRAENMSAWVNDALRLKADHDRRMRALDEFLAAYEAEHGEITGEEIRAAARRARARSSVVRAPDASVPPSGDGQGVA